MTLELDPVAKAMPRVVSAAQTDARRDAVRAALARQALRTDMPVEQIAERVRSSGRQEALAIPLEPPSFTRAAPPLGSYTIVAVDGSHHELDRYSSTRCTLVNLGGWRIRYGESSEAEQLYAVQMLTTDVFIRDDGTLIGSEDAADHPDAVTARSAAGALLGAYRGAWEAAFLAERVRAALGDPMNEPLIALMDGVLLPWTVPGMDEPARHQVARMYTNALSDLRASTEGRAAAIGSYVSHPRAGEVMAMLALLPPEAADLDGHADMLVFGSLAPGRRSACFETFAGQESWPQRDHFGPQGHGTGFFYVNTAPPEGGIGEIARVEFPTWLAKRPGAIALLHGAVLDQCRRNRGYPIGLQEAHERAVLTTGDRMAFETLVERALEAEGIVAGTAGKQMSKRVRGL